MLIVPPDEELRSEKEIRQHGRDCPPDSEDDPHECKGQKTFTDPAASLPRAEGVAEGDGVQEKYEKSYHGVESGEAEDVG